jgi:hypothetical protein
MKRRLFGMPVAAGLCAVVFLGLAAAAGAYSNDFDSNTAGWFNNDGTITKQPSGYDNDVYAEGIASASDGFHARLDRGPCSFDGPPPGGIGPSVNCSGPYTYWGDGNKYTWNGPYQTQVDIYLDAAYANDPANEDSPVGNLDLITDPTNPDEKGTRFDYTSAINSSIPDGNGDAQHLRDFGFVVGTGQPGNTCTGWVVNAQMNVNRSNAFPDDTSKNPACISETGWFTFKHSFFENVDGNLEVLMQIIDIDTSTVVAHWNIVSGDFVEVDGVRTFVPNEIEDAGCNRYGWFSNQEIFGLPIDNASMTGGCAAPTITDGQILPTGTTCQGYNAGTNPLDTVQYTLNKGKINSVAPGVFFYYGTISGTADQTFTITQTDNSAIAPFIPVQHGQVILYDTSCNVVKWNPDTDANGVVTGTLPSTGTFIISVKYSPAGLKGVNDPGTVTYTIDGTSVELAPKPK